MDLGYPKLRIGKLGDGFWENFVRDMNLAIESEIDRRGFENVDGDRVPVVRGRRKLVPLIRAIGSEACEVLSGAGFDVHAEDSTYEGAMIILNAEYGVQETRFVRGQRFFSACQLVGESNWDFKKRVESLGRKADMHGEDDDLRQEMSLIVAVNGLSDRQLSTELMRNEALTWAVFGTTLRARENADNSARLLRGVRSNNESVNETAVEIKTEVASISSEVCSNDRKMESRNDNSDSRSARVCRECKSSRHEIRDCPHVKCFSCGKRGHIARYCKDKTDRYDRDNSNDRYRNRRDYSSDRYRGRRDYSNDRYRDSSNDRYRNRRDNSNDRYQRNSRDTSTDNYGRMRNRGDGSERDYYHRDRDQSRNRYEGKKRERDSDYSYDRSRSSRYNSSRDRSESPSRQVRFAEVKSNK